MEHWGHNIVQQCLFRFYSFSCLVSGQSDALPALPMGSASCEWWMLSGKNWAEGIATKFRPICANGIWWKKIAAEPISRWLSTIMHLHRINIATQPPWSLNGYAVGLLSTRLWDQIAAAVESHGGRVSMRAKCENARALRFRYALKEPQVVKIIPECPTMACLIIE